MSLHQRQRMWFMRDGVPPRFLHIFIEHLNLTFGEQWIGNDPHNINPLDFQLWRHRKALALDLEALQQ